jgi:hypothetical protein
MGVPIDILGDLGRVSIEKVSVVAAFYGSLFDMSVLQCYTASQR